MPIYNLEAQASSISNTIFSFVFFIIFCRILNNYFVWQIAMKYAKDLSYEYIHARKQYYKDRYGAREFQSPDSYCFNYIKRNMPDALSHIFIMDHFADKNKKKVCFLNLAAFK